MQYIITITQLGENKIEKGCATGSTVLKKCVIWKKKLKRDVLGGSMVLTYRYVLLQKQ